MGSRSESFLEPSLHVRSHLLQPGLQQIEGPVALAYISTKVAKEVEKKLAFGPEPMGVQKMKNLTEPVEVYRVKFNPPRVSQSAASYNSSLISMPVTTSNRGRDGSYRNLT